MEVYLFKLNGWSDNFGERIEALSRSVDSLVVFRSKPEHDDRLDERENVTVVDLAPARGTFVELGWLKPFVFVAHVVQAFVYALVTIVRRRHRPDAVHALDYILGGLAARLTASLSRVPLVISVRGLKEPAYKNMVTESGSWRSKVNYRILLALSDAIIPYADHIITKADYQRDFVRRAYETDCEFTTVPTGIDFDTFDPGTVNEENPFDRLFPEANVDWETATVLLFMGKFINRKGFERYIDFAESFDEVEGDVVFTAVGGYRDDAFRDRLAPRIRELGDRVFVYPDRIEFDRIPSLLSHSSAIVLLSEPKNEGVPRSLQEAYAMQTPVIASDVTGISRAFKDLPGCYLIDRRDSEAFKRAVERIRSETVEMNREAGKERFDIYDNYAKYADVYSSISE